MKFFTYSMTQIYVYIREYKCVPINDDKMLKMNTDTRTTKFQHRLFCRSRRQLDLRMRAPSTHLTYTLILRVHITSLYTYVVDSNLYIYAFLFICVPTNTRIFCYIYNIHIFEFYMWSYPYVHSSNFDIRSFL